MKWWPPWRRAEPPANPDAQLPDEQRKDEALRAVADAEATLAQVRSAWPEIRRRGERARRAQVENHLADLVRRNLRGYQP